MENIFEKTKNFSIESGKKTLKKTANFTSKIVGITSAIKTGAIVGDTSFTRENIWNYTSLGVKQGCESIRNFTINSLHEIINFSDIVDVPLIKIPDTNKSLIELSEIGDDFTQIASNLGLYENSIKEIISNPEKLEGASTILVSMGIVGLTFTFLIPKILEIIIQEKN